MIAITREESRLKYRVDNDQLQRLIPFMTLRGCLLFSEVLEEMCLNPTITDEVLYSFLVEVLEIDLNTEFFFLRQAFLQNDALRTAKLRMDERL